MVHTPSSRAPVGVGMQLHFDPLRSWLDDTRLQAQQGFASGGGMKKPTPAAQGAKAVHLEALHQPVLLLDRGGTVVGANRSACCLLNIEEGTAITLQDCAPVQGVERLLEAAASATSRVAVPGPVLLFDAVGPCATWLAALEDDSVIVSLEPTVAQARPAAGRAESQASLDARLFRANPTPVALCDLRSRRLLDASVSYFEVLGLDIDASIGEPLWQHGNWLSKDDFERLFAALESNGTVRQLETRLLTRHREQIECVVSGERCVVSGRDVAVLAVTDVSARKRAERASALLETQIRQTQKLEAIGTLAGGIAHDFNNILGSIVARSALAVADADEPELVKQHIAEINVATDRAKALVRRILTFSRQKAQDRVPVSLDAVLREALDLVRPTLPATANIELDVQGGLPEVLADATQIHQVIINLCNNAAYALEGKVGTISISLRPVIVDQTMVIQVPELRCGNYACLSVTDTGHGMDGGTLERVFDPFFTTKEPGQGTGLGLAVVHGVVREHEGAIIVDSAPDIGTSFQLYFPETVERSLPDSDISPAVLRGHGEHILLVDDERSLCGSVAALLTKIGYQVTAFTDPHEALECLKQDPFAVDILLTDLTMPGLTGLDLSRAAVALRPDLPVVVTSGYTASWDHRQGEEAGVLEFRQKPVGFAELSQSIRQAISSRQQAAC